MEQRVKRRIIVPEMRDPQLCKFFQSKNKWGPKLEDYLDYMKEIREEIVFLNGEVISIPNKTEENKCKWYYPLNVKKDNVGKRIVITDSDVKKLHPIRLNLYGLIGKEQIDLLEKAGGLIKIKEKVRRPEKQYLTNVTVIPNDDESNQILSKWNLHIAEVSHDCPVSDSLYDLTISQRNRSKVGIWISAEHYSALYSGPHNLMNFYWLPKDSIETTLEIAEANRE